MAKRSRQDSLAAELLMSNSEDEAGSSTNVAKANEVAKNDPMLELMKSMQATFASEFHKIRSHMSRLEGDIRKVKKTHDEPRGTGQRDGGSRCDNYRSHKAVTKKTATTPKSVPQPKQLFPMVKVIVPDVCKGRKLANSADEQSSHNLDPRLKTNQQKCATAGNVETVAEKKSFNGIKYRKVEQPTQESVVIPNKAKPKSILMAPRAAELNDGASKRYINLSDDSEDSYDEKLARSVPILSDAGSISKDEIMKKAAVASATDQTPESRQKMDEKTAPGAGYRRMISTSATTDAHSEIRDSKTRQPLDIVEKCEKVKDAQQQRSTSAASYDSIDDLLANMEILPDTPTPMIRVPTPVRQEVAKNVSVEAPKQSTVSKIDMAMAAAKQASNQPGTVTSNEIRSRTKPAKVSSGRPAGPIVVDAPPMSKPRPASGGTTSSRSRDDHRDPSGTSTSAARDPTRRTQFVTVETSHNKGKEVCLEGELKREKGINVPYINIVLATNGETGKRPSRFLLKATTMEKLIKGGSFNAVMLKLRRLDPGNPNCDLWV